MKKIIFIFFFFLPISQAFGKWTLISSLNPNRSSYVSENNSYLTVSTSESKENNNTHYVDANLMREIEKAKKESLPYIGIKNWKASKYKIKRDKNNILKISFNGSYIYDDQLTFFTEIHFYKNKKNLKFLLSNTNKNKLNRDMKKFSISHFRKKYEF